MVDSKYTHIRVNNEIELCEVYEREVKDRVEKAFVKNGISFFVQCKRVQNGNNRYIIHVNQHQKQRAEAAIHSILEDVNENVNFMEEEKGNRNLIRKFLPEKKHNLLAILNKM